MELWNANCVCHTDDERAKGSKTHLRIKILTPQGKQLQRKEFGSPKEIQKGKVVLGKLGLNFIILQCVIESFILSFVGLEKTGSQTLRRREWKPIL